MLGDDAADGQHGVVSLVVHQLPELRVEGKTELQADQRVCLATPLETHTVFENVGRRDVRRAVGHPHVSQSRGDLSVGGPRPRIPNVLVFASGGTVWRPLVTGGVGTHTHGPLPAERDSHVQHGRRAVYM